ncbi:hypothetical protein [Streptomyces cinereoruber]|uniref:hypothetical protein n=1 Tax=Streptomyces cinereoruber TaxID=67260 RepID=UPI00364396E7
MTTAVQTGPLTVPEMEGTYFGIPVAYYGEEGNMLALDHHTPRRALAAFNRHARTFCGLANIADDQNTTVDDWVDGIGTAWFVFRVPEPGLGQGADCLWYGRQVAPGDPNALPVTLLMT